MSAAQTERSEKAFQDISSFWKNNLPSFPMTFLDMEKQREVCREIWKIDQGYGLKIYSLWVERLMKMLTSGYTGNAGEIYRNGNECWTEMTALMGKYFQERSTATARFYQAFLPAKETPSSKA